MEDSRLSKRPETEFSNSEKQIEPSLIEKKPLVNSLPGPLDSDLLTNKKAKRSMFVPKGKVKTALCTRDCKSRSEIRNSGTDKIKIAIL